MSIARIVLFVFKKIFDVYSFLRKRERERESEWGRGRERERETQNLKQAPAMWG